MPKIVADMHVPPAFRRWGARLGLAVLIAVAIGYVPGEVGRRDPRAAKLEAQIEELTAEARQVAVLNAGMAREIAALRSDIGAIEDRARADLGMVYSDEVVLRLEAEPMQTESSQLVPWQVQPPQQVQPQQESSQATPTRDTNQQTNQDSTQKTHTQKQAEPLKRDSAQEARERTKPELQGTP